jgi:hypothetical protein
MRIPREMRAVWNVRVSSAASLRRAGKPAQQARGTRQARKKKGRSLEAPAPALLSKY